jgi:thioredoxin-related protein
MKRFVTILYSLLALSGCAKLGLTPKPEDAKKEPQNPFGPTGIPPAMRAGSSVEGTPVKAGSNVDPKSKMLNITPEEDIVFTDPDHPNQAVPELTDLLSQAKRGPWESSEATAKQLSAREGKPLLIWFTDSVRSPMCKALTEELFSSNDFGKWAEEKLVRLRVDSNIESDDPNLSLDEKGTRLIDIKNYVSGLKKRYKILGFPSLVLLNPSGEVIGRYRGYKRGDSAYFWGQLKHGEAVSTEANKAWRKQLEAKGYREWEDRKKRKFFAKLTSYSKGVLQMIEPDGNRAQTNESSLCDADRGWIADQKKLRSIE